VDAEHNTFNTPLKDGNDRLHHLSEEAMAQEPYTLDTERRACVMATIREVCDHRGWILFAAHVRNTHLHVVVHGNHPPERIGGDFKSYASRRLNQAGFGHSERRRWARHQSNPYLWSIGTVQAAMRYTIHEQGEPMQVFIHPELRGYDLQSHQHEVDVDLRELLKRHGVL
jgi:REP element-mobilizing transposase RayT